MKFQLLKFSKNKMKLIFLSLFAGLVLIRIILPSILLKKINIYLANSSTIYEAKVEDLNLNLLSAAFTFENFQLSLKKSSKKMLEIKKILVHLSWRKLIKRQVILDIHLLQARASYYKGAISRGKKSQVVGNKDAPDENKNFVFRIDKLIIENSSFDYSQKANANADQHIRIDDLNIVITNISPQQKESTSQFKLNGKIAQSATIKIKGQAKPYAKTFDWNIDLELNNLYLPSINGFLSTIPLTFHKGKLDLFAELKSENGNIEGYAKPFLKDVDMVDDKKDFIGGKHFLLEIFSAYGNSIFKNQETDTVASKIYFRSDTSQKGLKVDSKTAIKSALKYQDKKENLSPSTNKEIQLNK